MSRSGARALTASTLAILACAAAPANAAASRGGALLPVGFLGLPSLHSIIQAIAGGFFGALASALVPGFLKHGTVATIQQLVALPDPATWAHVGALQGEMTYLAAMLLPLTLAVTGTRYWLVGLTGAAHPASAVLRCAAATGVLVAYRWIVEQTVAATNTLTHGILGLPTVASGLQRIIGVLFGGALLTGTGGVFGAFLVIIGVVLAAGLFAAQVLLTVVLGVLVVAGPPLIAVSAIPELSHLARAWADTLMAVALIPLGWTVLFATAGALCLDATSFTGAGGGVPGHVAAAFAGLITFALAVKLPLMLLGEARHIFSRGRHAGSRAAHPPSGMPGAERVRAAHTRLRSVGMGAVPSLGASVGRAAGAFGAPVGGPLGAARRGLTGAGRRAGVHPMPAGGAQAATTGTSKRTPGVRRRLADAASILASAPADAAAAGRASGKQRSPARAVPGPSTRPTPAPPSTTARADAPGSAASSTRRGRAEQTSSRTRPAPDARPKGAAPLTARPISTGGRGNRAAPQHGLALATEDGPPARPAGEQQLAGSTPHPRSVSAPAPLASPSGRASAERQPAPPEGPSTPGRRAAAAAAAAAARGKQTPGPTGRSQMPRTQTPRPGPRIPGGSRGGTGKRRPRSRP